VCKVGGYLPLVQLFGQLCYSYKPFKLEKNVSERIISQKQKNDKKARGSREYCTSEYIYILFCWFSQALPIGHITEVRAELFERLSDFKKKCSDKNLRKQFPRNGLIFFF